MSIKRIGFTCGAFDLLHPGHLMMLEDAKRQCDVLVVGLHVDPSVERPEKNKPIESVYERLIRLYACRYVDLVVIYHTETELETILSVLRPDVRIIGSDWRGKPITGEDLCIPIYWHERGHNYSSSNLRERIVNGG